METQSSQLSPRAASAANSGRGSPFYSLDRMAMRIPPIAAYAIAVIGIPVIYGIVAQLTYSFAVVRGLWPSEVYWFLIIGALVGCGAFFVARQPGPSAVWRLVIGGAYSFIILIPIALIHLFVACSNGDCF